MSGVWCAMCDVLSMSPCSAQCHSRLPLLTLTTETCQRPHTQWGHHQPITSHTQTELWCINIRKLLLNISSLLLLTLIIMGQQSLNSLLHCLFCGNSYLSSCFLKNFIGQCNILNFCLILFFCWSWSTYTGLLPENSQVGRLLKLKSIRIPRNINQRSSFNI